MKRIRIIAIMILLIGCAYEAFWMTALREWRLGGRYQRGQLTKEQFEQTCPALMLVFQWWDFHPFENKYEDRAIHPGTFVYRGIIGHSIIGGLVILAGLAGFVISVIRKGTKSEPGGGAYPPPAARLLQGKSRATGSRSAHP